MMLHPTKKNLIYFNVTAETFDINSALLQANVSRCVAIGCLNISLENN